MEPFVIGIIGIALLVLLLACGVHIALALGAVGLFGSIFLVGFDASAWMGTKVVYGIVANRAFIVLPLFIFMGLMAGAAGMSRALYQSLALWVGRLRGGLGIATIGSCAGFGVCTGSSLVTAAVFAKVSAPEMRRQGYDKKAAYGICASGGAIGMLIPPSILLVIYGIISQLSVGKLLIAGLAPGIILTLTFSMGIVAMSSISPASYGRAYVTKATWRERFSSLKSMWSIVVVAAIVIGGLFSGIFNPTEAGAFGALAILIIAMFTTGSERWKTLSSGILESISITAMIFFILVGAGIFARFLALSGISTWMLGLVIDAGLSNITFVIAMAAVYLIMGCFLDSISMLSITLPVIIPVVGALGIDPIWFAMVTVLAIEVGLITPPVGLNVYATKGVAESDVSLEDVFRGVLPFFLMMLVSLAIIIAFPWLSTILPKLMM